MFRCRAEKGTTPPLASQALLSELTVVLAESDFVSAAFSGELLLLGLSLGALEERLA
jgi:hypothetical protein